ncbi:hypothetical protein DV096_13730 [Bradymonadaceae bacterium TMQ3]|nr:hypothetical protein DV096_13730 [Bradymonadaceae bacterium TMQ3]
MVFKGLTNVRAERVALLKGAHQHKVGFGGDGRKFIKGVPEGLDAFVDHQATDKADDEVVGLKAERGALFGAVCGVKTRRVKAADGVDALAAAAGQHADAIGGAEVERECGLAQGKAHRDGTVGESG